MADKPPIQPLAPGYMMRAGMSANQERFSIQLKLSGKIVPKRENGAAYPVNQRVGVALMNFGNSRARTRGEPDPFTPSQFSTKL
jgi:hypothetical protein